jgi:antitoxin StbD
MTASVPASDVQKNFGLWHDRALKEPVQITQSGRETIYLLSAETFHELWSSYRRAGSTLELTETEVSLMDETKIPPEHDYDYEDDPAPTAGSPRAGK